MDTIIRVLAVSALSLVITCCNTSKKSTDFKDKLSTRINDKDNPPNILLVIADDLGKDHMPGYDIGGTKPKMPVISKLMNQGVRFENFWAFPTCTPTRSSIITGKYGFRNNMTSVGSELSTSETTLQQYISQNSPHKYANAVIGKWHLSEDVNHPAKMGVEHHAGITNGGTRDYSSWKMTKNGVQSRENTYITSKITDEAISWLSNQNGKDPWFLWLAYTAPHTPFHKAPNNLHSNDDLSESDAEIESNPVPYFHTMIEAMDTEFGRLLNSLPKQQRDNTVIIFIGDNGTPNQVAQEYRKRRVKGSVYQGGVNTPLFVSGANIDRVNEVENSLVNSTDLFATIAELAGIKVESIHDSKSFEHLLSQKNRGKEYREFLYSEAAGKRKKGVAIANQDYKYIVLDGSTKEFYDLKNDPFEKMNLLSGTLSSEQQQNYDKLVQQLNDLLSSKEENPEHTHTHTHDGSTHSHDHGTFSVTSGINCTENTSHSNQVKIEVKDGFRHITSNAIPDHSVGSFPNRGNPHTMTPQNKNYKVSSNPQKVSKLTSVYRGTGLGQGGPAYEFGVAINGVKMEPSAAEFFTNPETRERNTNWPKEALSTTNRLGEDCNNAHVQPNGEYHYHGTPWGIVEKAKGDKMFLVGWAADGFPIYYKWAYKNPNDKNSGLVVMKSSYRLKSGSRSGDGKTEPNGTYDGTYVRDFIYEKGSGDLDEANARYGVTPEFSKGTWYYMITDDFPSISRFFIGTPDESFKIGQGGSRQGNRPKWPDDPVRQKRRRP